MYGLSWTSSPPTLIPAEFDYKENQNAQTHKLPQVKAIFGAGGTVIYAGLLVRLTANELVAMLVGTSFAAGLNVYATVATLGLLARFDLLLLPDSLHLLENWWIIAASIILFVIEFFADKVPAFDLIWNALHTFVRVPVAALLAYAATSQLSPGKQILATLLGGLIALAAHGGKTAVRAAVTPSPEPISNIGLSLGEDALAIFLTWFATQHPYSAAAIVLVLVVIIALLIRWVVRALRALFCGAQYEFVHSQPGQ